MAAPKFQQLLERLVLDPRPILVVLSLIENTERKLKDLELFLSHET